jgi:hypothetical protein
LDDKSIGLGDDIENTCGVLSAVFIICLHLWYVTGGDTLVVVPHVVTLTIIATTIIEAATKRSI